MKPIKTTTSGRRRTRASLALNKLFWKLVRLENMSQKEWAEFIAAEINDCPVKPSFRVRWDNHRQEFYEK